MDVDKLILPRRRDELICRFGPLMDVDKLIQAAVNVSDDACFGPLMDVDKLILKRNQSLFRDVLGL